MPAPAGAATVPQLLAYLREHRQQWSVAAIARAAKLPRSVVRKAIGPGGNPTLRTLTAITKVLGGELMVAISPGANQLLDV